MTDEEKRLKQREYSRNYRLRHPERIREAKRKHRQANPEKEREANRRYYLEHPDKIKEIQARRKSRPCPDCGKMNWKLSGTCKECYSKRQKKRLVGEHNPRWKGGVRMIDGYIQRKAPGHPAANTLGYVQEHRLIMEKMLGRTLKKGELVHHKNQNRADNRPENLLLCTMSEHKKIHYALEREK